MAVDLATVIKQLTDSGIIAPGKLENFIPPKADPKTPEELVQALIKSENLTTFQGQQVKAGRVKSLILGAYTILDKIGAGGMGQVFKAEHRRMERLVAIKMLPPSTAKDAAAVARFHREVKAAAKLRHTNIVAADDAAEANGAHFLVMEYVDGKDLSAMVKKDGPFPVGQAVNFILQAARGLEFAHGEGVVHRDIKPGNLLLDKKGVVKILDMGLARIESDGPAQTELTGTGTIMGTVDYMSPEQALNTKNADHRADIYSLGISLYYLLAGKAAYGGDTAMEKLMAHQTQPIPSLQDAQATVSKQLEAVFKKMVAKRIEDRYQSMSEVIEALEALGYGGSITGGKGNVASTLGLSSADRKKLLSQAKKQPLSSITEVVASEKSKNLILKIVGGSFGTIIAPILVFYLIRHLDKQEQPANPPAATTPAATVQPVAVATNTTSPTTSPVASGGNAPWNTPEFQAWIKEVQAMPAGQQVIAVNKKLVELNPGFDGKATPNLERGMVTGLDFATEHVTDISPVRALAGLQSLTCNAAQKGNARSELFELSPLVGMKLTKLECANTEVFDLSPLHGMPLEALNVAGTKATDLSPLHGLPLTTLNMSSTKATDLSPLQGLPLASLILVSTPVTDLSPLKGMSSLTTLSCQQCKQLADFLPLADCQALTLLKATTTKLTPAQVAALQKALPNCKIEWDDPAKAAAAQQSKPWESPAFLQWVKATQALPAEKQVEVVKAKLLELNPKYNGNGKPKIVGGVVTEFDLPNAGIADISPLRAFSKLKSLRTDGVNAISDLSPLQSLPLATLRCMQNPISDLSPLEDCETLKNLNVTRTKVTPASVAALQKALPNCKIEWDDPAKPKVATGGKPWESPAFLQWVKDVQAMPAEKQVEAVSKKLMELNPAFDGRLTSFDGRKTPTIENGVVTGLALRTHSVTDISPLRALDGLTTLACVGSSGGEQRMLPTLSPLEGMRLQNLNCSATMVSDLSPLAGMPLTELKCAATLVSDLTPLQGMQLLYLACNDTQVSNVSPLETCKSLKVFRVSQTKVTPASVAALQKALPNCKIEWDDPAKASKPTLAYLDPAFQQWVNATQALPAEKQIEAVSKKLMELNPGFDGNVTVADWGRPFPPKIDKGVVTEFGFVVDNVTDISPVRALSGLKFLKCGGSGPGKGKLSDLSPLSGMTLTTFDCVLTPVSDLSPLEGMRLSTFSCAGTQVANLLPLKGMPLTELTFASTPISDLSQLQGIPLKILRCNDTQVSDLTPLTNMPALYDLIVLRTKVTPAGVAALQKALPNCKIKWDDPAKAPAKKLAYLDPAFQQWIKATQALPAEQQIEAVSKKLMELNPGFDGKVSGTDGKGTPKVENNVVTEFGFYTDNVTEISPVRALLGLKVLTCRGSSGPRKGRLSDLSPLRGMALTSLWCGFSQVSDLSPLDGMSLSLLSCHSTTVSDLSPLRGMPLTNLACSSTPVSDLSPLQDSKSLASLNIKLTKVTPASVAALQNALPNCKIEWDDPAKPKTPEPAASDKK